MVLYLKDMALKHVERGKHIVERLLGQNKLSMVDKDGQLWHHGIEGQKWGERNGPPYPLDESARSEDEKRAAEKEKPHIERDIAKQKSSSLKKGIRNLRAQIVEHEAKIKEPEKHCTDWESISEKRKEGLKVHWKKEIRNFQKSIDAKIEELKRRGDYNDE